MNYANHYYLRCKVDNRIKIIENMKQLAENLNAIDGCLGTEVSVNSENPNEFLFVEKWASVVDYDIGKSSINKDIMNSVLQLLETKPITQSYYTAT